MKRKCTQFSKIHVHVLVHWYGANRCNDNKSRRSVKGAIIRHDYHQQLICNNNFSCTSHEKIELHTLCSSSCLESVMIGVLGVQGHGVQGHGVLRSGSAQLIGLWARSLRSNGSEMFQEGNKV